MFCAAARLPSALTLSFLLACWGHCSAMRRRMLRCGPCCADVDEAAKKEVKDILLSYDRTLLVADPRRCEPKKCASFYTSSTACCA